MPLGGDENDDSNGDNSGTTETIEAGDEFKVEVISPEPVAAAAPLQVEPVVAATPTGGAFDDFMIDSTPSTSTGLDTLADLSSPTPSSGDNNMTSINLDGGNMGDSLI